MEIPAHKLLLSICSPVFFAMFCGEMAETKEHIDLPDCEYEGMLELLRYIYTDEVCFNENNVMQVLYLAEKYMIPSLTSKCNEYLQAYMDPSNVFCILKHAQKFENKDLLFECWDFIDNVTDKALKSDEFLTIERSLLEELVQRDTLNVTEVELFKAVNCWAKEECMRLGLTLDGSVKRQILGEQVIKCLRFPIMEKREFEEFVLNSNILTQEETSNIMKNFICTVTLPVGFLEAERRGCFLRCSRFSKFLKRDGFYWDNSPDSLPDIMTMTVDKEILLRGVSLFGQNHSDYSVTLSISKDEDTSVLTTVSGNFTAEKKKCKGNYYHGFDVLFDHSVALTKNVKYCIEASIDGPSCFFGNEGFELVDCEGVSFRFGFDWENDRASELFNPGQIPEILFEVI
ncbi:BTB/POZ domain-containing protein 6-like [Oculina patagonica]